MKTARKFEFTDLSLGLTRILRMHYGTRLGDVKKFRKYNDFYKTYTDLWLAENLAEEYYATLVTEYVLSKAKKEDVEKAAMLYLNDLESAAAEYNSYRLQLSVRLIEMIRANVLQDYQQVIAICQQSIDFFDKKPYDAPVPLQIFLHQELVCNIQLRQFERGQQVAQKALDSVEEGSFNWFKHQELYLLLCLHTDAFQQAYEVYQTVFQHKRFRFLADNLRELWYIYEAFIQYLKTIGHIEAEDSSPFRLGRFMNQTPIFSQDKRGMNIPILVVQILFMIIQNKYDKAIDRIEAVEKYCSRYLRKDETFRSNCFIKMLLTIPKSSFHKAAVERHATPLFKKLQQVPPDATGQSYEIEIIPYEKLWTFVLNSLDDKFHKPYSANF